MYHSNWDELDGLIREDWRIKLPKAGMCWPAFPTRELGCNTHYGITMCWESHGFSWHLSELCKEAWRPQPRPAVFTFPSRGGGWLKHILFVQSWSTQQWWLPCNFWITQSHAACSMGITSSLDACLILPSFQATLVISTVFIWKP